MNVSVVLPAYNEEKAISNVLREVKDAFHKLDHVDDFEIIVVDDGSTDKTVHEAQKVDGIKILRNPTNLGFGASLKKGILQAQYETILMLDADGTYPLDQLDSMVSLMGPQTMVVGERNLTLFGYSWMRRVAKWILRAIVFFVAGKKIKDLNSGLRFFNKKEVETFFPIISDGFSFTTTLTLAYLSRQLNVVYVPIKYRKRYGKSKINPVKDTLRIITLIFRNIMFFGPMRVFMFVAAVSFTLTVISLLYDVFLLRNITDKSTLFFVTGAVFFFAGLIADLVHKKFEILEKKLDQLADKKSQQEMRNF